MSYPFIASRWLTQGRISPITLIVLHTIESPCKTGMALSAADYCRRRPDKVSAHYFVDPTTIYQGVRESDTAFCAPGANANGIHIEQAGYARFTTGEWSAPDPVAMEKNTAKLLADISSRRNIPLLFQSAADLLGPNPTGVTTHREVAQAFHRTDHTDPGPNYPMDYVLIEARALLGVGAAGNPPAMEDDMLPCVIPSSATPDTSGRFDFYRLTDKGGGRWTVKGYNGAKIRDVGGDLDEVALPFPLQAPPVGMAEHQGFVVVVAEDGGTFAYQMVLA